MVSMPAYDPNSFSDGIGRTEWRMLSEDPRRPLLNKVLNSLYPPGSTIKPMNSLALQAAGHRSRRRRIHCPGGYRLGNRFFRCLGRHGTVDMRRAIAKSCNTYFYAMGNRIGYDRIAPIATQLGLGQKFDLPVVSQSYGTVPDSEWKAAPLQEEPEADRAAGLDRVRHAERVDRPGLPDPQPAAAGGDGGAHRLGPQRPAAADRRAQAAGAAARLHAGASRGRPRRHVGSGQRRRHRRRQPPAGSRHRDGRQDRHRAGAADRRRPARPERRLEISRPRPVRLLRALRTTRATPARW